MKHLLRFPKVLKMYVLAWIWMAELPRAGL